MRTYYYPYMPSAPRRPPAGTRYFNQFQRVDFSTTRSPDPSPINSPLKSSCHLDDDAPPTLRFADYIANIFGSPQYPSPRSPHENWDTPQEAQNSPQLHQDNPQVHRDPTPEVKEKRFPGHYSLSTSFIRKEKRVPKNPSFSNNADRSGIFPHRRAKQAEERRENARKRAFERQRSVILGRKGIRKLCREAAVVMESEHMNKEDKVFLQQLENIELDQALDDGLDQCRQRIGRAIAEASQRRHEHAKRDVEAAKLRRERHDGEALEEQKRKVDEFVRLVKEEEEEEFLRMEEAAMHVDEQRRRAHEAWERQIREDQERLFREEMARRAEEERQKRAEQVRQLQEENDRRLQEFLKCLRRAEERKRLERERMAQERARRLREEHVRRLREEHARRLREEREREEQERREKEQERERQARDFAEQARCAATQENQLRQYFDLYETKWNELWKKNNDLSPASIDVRQMPWPVFGIVYSAEQITSQDVRTFLFHPQRPGVEGKTARDKVKAEVLRFHPDKFNTRVLPKVQLHQQEIAEAIAGEVARILTNIMTEDSEQQ